MSPIKPKNDKRRPKTEPDVFDYYSDVPGAGKSHTVFLIQGSERADAAAWQDLRTEILSAWQRQRPCQRPRAWWRHEAPEARRRLGGRGVPKSEALAYAPELVRGIPAAWIEALDVRLWPELADKQVDPADPPSFESEAAFLQRMGLLSATEQRHLRQHPELLEHERINLEEEDDKDAV